jgi:hypothetical protein
VEVEPTVPVSPGLGVVLPSGVSYYRITSLAFRTRSAAHHKKVVNGEGAVRSRHGARYNYPGVRSVYLADTPLTCYAERMFYFHREVLTGLDGLHLASVPIVPPFHQRFILWDVVLRAPVADVFDLSVANAPAAGVFPCLMLNPSQDYLHLKDRRAAIQSAGYLGLRAPSARAAIPGNLVVLFDDQSGNMASMTPYEVEFRMVTPAGVPFASHAADQLDYLAGEIRVIPPHGAAAPPAAIAASSAWQRVQFNH